MKSNDVIENAVVILKEVSNIVLGTNSDGTPRSIIDAKLALEKSRRKRAKKIKNKRRT